MGRYDTGLDDVGAMPEWLVWAALIAAAVGVLRGITSIAREGGALGLIEPAAGVLAFVAGVWALAAGRFWLGMALAVGGPIVVSALIANLRERNRQRDHVTFMLATARRTPPRADAPRPDGSMERGAREQGGGADRP